MVVYVQQEISFAVGYTIPLVSMVIAVILFLVPSRRYKNNPPRGLFIAYETVAFILQRRLKTASAGYWLMWVYMYMYSSAHYKPAVRHFIS